jgi:hypothetical protein
LRVCYPVCQARTTHYRTMVMNYDESVAFLPRCDLTAGWLTVGGAALEDAGVEFTAVSLA